MEKFSIDIDRPNECRPSYELSDKNVMWVRAGTKGDRLDSNDSFVEIGLSRDAMLALGTELIRSALRPGDKLLEVFPIDQHLASQSLGVYLHPSSCRLLIFLHHEFGKVDALLTNQRKGLNGPEQTGSD